VRGGPFLQKKGPPRNLFQEPLLSRRFYCPAFFRAALHAGVSTYGGPFSHAGSSVPVVTREARGDPYDLFQFFSVERSG